MNTRIVALGAAALLGTGAVAYTAAGPKAAAAAPVDLGCFRPPALTPALPGAPPVNDQNDFNCFGWQEFIALNWPVSATAGQPDTTQTASSFGVPGSAVPATWETFRNASDVFLPDGSAPAPWGAVPALPPQCNTLFQAGVRPATPRPRVLRMTSKLSVDAQLLDEDVEPGFTAPDPTGWLTAQNGKTVWYEVLMNEVMFQYIVSNRFYDANAQYDSIQAGVAIAYPLGSFSGGPGALEIKAAWLELPNPSDWPRYRMSEAYLQDPATGACRVARVGLVAMHIVQKSTTQWAWASFEHVDNAPDAGSAQMDSAWTFYTPHCTLSDSLCAPNNHPDSGQSRSIPVQVVRSTPIHDNPPDNMVASLNDSTRRMIVAANPASVYQNYRMVNTLWPQSSATNPPGAKVPLQAGGATPGIMANAVIETYGQTRGNCMGCHSFAGIAPSAGAGENPQWGADYSFLLSRARPGSSGASGASGSASATSPRR